jgi:hypothetical protein
MYPFRGTIPKRKDEVNSFFNIAKDLVQGFINLILL